MEENHTETHQSSFRPSSNVILLPVFLFILGLGMLMYSIFEKTMASSETRFISWGCMIAGVIGSGLNFFYKKRYLLHILKSSLIFVPDQLSSDKIEVDTHDINQVDIQQSAIGRLLRYGNLHIKYDEGDLFIQDIEYPDQVKRLLSVS